MLTDRISFASDPFHTEDDAHEEAASALPPRYELVPAGPAVSPEEVETAATCVEVTVLWGEDTVLVRHLGRGETFSVGSDDAASFLLPEGLLGASRLAVIAGLSAEGQAFAAAPGDDRATLTREEPSCFSVGDFTFEVRAVNAGKKTKAAIFADKRPLAAALGSAMFHLGLIGSMLAFLPPLGATDGEGIDEDSKAHMQHLLAAAAMPEVEEQAGVMQDASEGETGEMGERAPGAEGAMGNPTAKDTGKKFALSGEGREVRMSRAQVLQDAQDFGMIGLLSSLDGGTGPNSPWGDIEDGMDPMSARGAMFGSDYGENYGIGGLGLSGIGEAGGNGHGMLGLGSIGTIGTCMTAGCGGRDGGWGRSNSFLAGSHQHKDHTMRQADDLNLSGRLPPEIIQRVVRQNFGRFRLCYQNGLANQPNLQGRVAVSFVIGRDGSVSMAQNGGSDLPDPGVVSCVVSAFYGLSFPAPDNGVVRVTYPIVFSPAS